MPEIVGVSQGLISLLLREDSGAFSVASPGCALPPMALTSAQTLRHASSPSLRFLLTQTETHWVKIIKNTLANV